VIGKDFAEPLLLAVAELPAEELKASLAALRRAEFVYEQAIYPVVEYSFKHPLTQEVALGSQLKERRRAVHAAVARAIEQQHAEHLDERAPLLAHHYEEAGELRAAVRWHGRAAEWVETTDVAAANRHWGRVRELLRELPGDREAQELGIQACQQILQMAWRFGMGVDEARGLLEEGQALASATGDRRAAVRLSMVYGRARCGAGDVTAYLELMAENVRAASEIDDVHLQAGACALHVDALAFGARLPEALRVAEEGIARFPRHIPVEEWGSAFNPCTVMTFFVGHCAGWMGRLPEALEIFGRHRRLCEEDGTPEFIGYGHLYSSEVHYRAHEAERALASARQVEEISRRLGEPPSLAAYSHLGLAFAQLAAGRFSEGIEAARRALEQLGRVERFQAGMAAELLAEGLLQAGDAEAARSAAEEAIALCRRSERSHYEAAAHGILARALLRSEGAAAREAAEAALDAAAALIERTGARLLLPSLSEWRAELAAAWGDEATQERELHEAHRLFAEMGAIGHAQRLSATVAGGG
jgi:adenylate cyclase